MLDLEHGAERVIDLACTAAISSSGGSGSSGSAPISSGSGTVASDSSGNSGCVERTFASEAGADGKGLHEADWGKRCVRLESDAHHLNCLQFDEGTLQPGHASRRRVHLRARRSSQEEGEAGACIPFAVRVQCDSQLEYACASFHRARVAHCERQFSYRARW